MNGVDLNVTDAWTLWVIVGLAIITAVTRSFFFLMSRILWSRELKLFAGLRGKNCRTFFC